MTMMSIWLYLSRSPHGRIQTPQLGANPPLIPLSSRSLFLPFPFPLSPSLDPLEV